MVLVFSSAEYSLWVNYIMCAAYTFCGVWCQETSLLVKWASKGKFRRSKSFNCVNHKTVFKHLKGRSPRSCDSTSCMYPPSPSPPPLYYELLIQLSREIFRAWYSHAWVLHDPLKNCMKYELAKDIYDCVTVGSEHWPQVVDTGCNLLFLLISHIIFSRKLD